jgi:hypothetical protein
MADLSVVEKYSNYRLNLPDLQTVNKVTPIKGTITDFEQINDNPLRVSSKVKVQIEGYGESDYIPLFFCPKKDYWNTLQDESQIFNEDEKYYNNAWMSFRVDDEVKVITKENKPYAVIGHFDEVPRVGENIVKIVGDQTVYNNMVKIQSYDSEKGEDGLDLGLKLESELIKEKEIIDPPIYNTIGDSFSNLSFHKELWYIDSGSNELWDWYIEYFGAWCTYTKETIQQQLYRKYLVFLFKLGPYLYLVKITIYDWECLPHRTISVTEGVDWQTCGTGWFQSKWIPDLPPTPYDTCDDIYYGCLNPIPGVYFPGENSVINYVYKALYKKDLYESMKANPPDEEENPDGFVIEDWTDSLNNFAALAIHQNGPVKIYIRPHTKAELEAAGLWL